MKILIDQATHDALLSIGDVPENLRARFDAMTPAEGGYTLTLSDDDATALAELVQWSIRTDPTTGRPTPESAPFTTLIGLIDAAQF